jgi:hypothetical protein
LPTIPGQSHPCPQLPLPSKADGFCNGLDVKCPTQAPSCL